MKALQYQEYGSPEILKWQQVPIPQPGNGEVLVQVKAASINPTDNKMRAGILRFGPQYFPRTMGMDFSGVVAATGAGVSQFKEGDKVMGYLGLQTGSYAEYAVAKEAQVFKMWNSIGFEDATTLPMNAATALKMINDYVQPAAGDKILVIGASGGLGLFIVQYCKLQGATVTGTASGTQNIDAVKSAGADEVIDYKATDILKTGKLYNTIVDTSGVMDFDEMKSILTDDGSFSTLVPKSDPSKPGRTDGNKIEKLVNASPGHKDFEVSQALAASGKIKTFVGKTYPMEEAIQALKDFESGKLSVAGKVVLVQP